MKFSTLLVFGCEIGDRISLKYWPPEQLLEHLKKVGEAQNPANYLSVKARKVYEGYLADWGLEDSCDLHKLI